MRYAVIEKAWLACRTIARAPCKLIFDCSSQKDKYGSGSHDFYWMAFTGYKLAHLLLPEVCDFMEADMTAIIESRVVRKAVQSQNSAP